MYKKAVRIRSCINLVSVKKHEKQTISLQKNNKHYVTYTADVLKHMDDVAFKLLDSLLQTIVILVLKNDNLFQKKELKFCRQ